MGERHFHFCKIVPHGTDPVPARFVRVSARHGDGAKSGGRPRRFSGTVDDAVAVHRHDEPTPVFRHPQAPVLVRTAFLQQGHSAMATASGLVRPKRLKYQTYASGERA